MTFKEYYETVLPDRDRRVVHLVDYDNKKFVGHLKISKNGKLNISFVSNHELDKVMDRLLAMEVKFDSYDGKVTRIFLNGFRDLMLEEDICLIA